MLNPLKYGHADLGHPHFIFLYTVLGYFSLSIFISTNKLFAQMLPILRLCLKLEGCVYSRVRSQGPPLHCPKNNLNLRMKTKPVTDVSI